MFNIKESTLLLSFGEQKANTFLKVHNSRVIDLIIKLNDFFLINDEQIVKIEAEGDAHGFSSVLNWNISLNFPNIKLLLTKQLAYQLGLHPYHYLLTIKEKYLEYSFKKENFKTYCNLNNGMTQMKLYSSGLLSEPKFELTKISFSENELKDNLMGNKPCIYKNLNSFFFVDNCCPKLVHFYILSDLDDPLTSMYCKLSIKASRCK